MSDKMMKLAETIEAKAGDAGVTMLEKLAALIERGGPETMVRLGMVFATLENVKGPQQPAGRPRFRTMPAARMAQAIAELKAPAGVADDILAQCADEKISQTALPNEERAILVRGAQALKQAEAIVLAEGAPIGKTAFFNGTVALMSKLDEVKSIAADMASELAGVTNDRAQLEAVVGLYSEFADAIAATLGFQVRALLAPGDESWTSRIDAYRKHCAKQKAEFAKRVEECGGDADAALAVTYRRLLASHGFAVEGFEEEAARHADEIEREKAEDKAAREAAEGAEKPEGGCCGGGGCDSGEAGCCGGCAKPDAPAAPEGEPKAAE